MPWLSCEENSAEELTGKEGELAWIYIMPWIIHKADNQSTWDLTRLKL